MVKILVVLSYIIMCFSKTIFANSEYNILSQNTSKNPVFHIGLYGGTGDIIYDKDFESVVFSSGLYEKTKKSTSYMIDFGIRKNINNFYSVGISGGINNFDVEHSGGVKVKLFYGNNGFRSGGELKLNFSTESLMLENYLRVYSDSKYDVGFIASIGLGKAKLNEEVLLYGDFNSGYKYLHEKSVYKNSTLVKKFGSYFRGNTGILQKFEVSFLFISHKIKEPKTKENDIKETIKYIDGFLIGIKYLFK